MSIAVYKISPNSAYIRPQMPKAGAIGFGKALSPESAIELKPIKIPLVRSSALNNLVNHIYRRGFQTLQKVSGVLDYLRIGFTGFLALFTMWMPLPKSVREYMAGVLFFRPKKLASLHLIESDDLKAKILDVNFPSLDAYKTRLNGWYIEAANKNKPTAVFFHGRACNISQMEPILESFHRKGYGIFVFDYPGFGNSSGIPTENSLYDAGESACRFLKEKLNVPYENQLLVGHSLGGAVAVETAKRLPEIKKGLVLMCTFTKLREAFELRKAHYSRMLQSFVREDKIHFDFDSESKLKSLKTPVLVVHATKDDWIDNRMARRLFHAAKLNAKWADHQALEDVSHSHIDVFENAGDRFMGMLDGFLKKAAKTSR